MQISACSSWRARAANPEQQFGGHQRRAAQAGLHGVTPACDALMQSLTAKSSGVRGLRLHSALCHPTIYVAPAYLRCGTMMSSVKLCFKRCCKPFPRKARCSPESWAPQCPCNPALKNLECRSVTHQLKLTLLRWKQAPAISGTQRPTRSWLRTCSAYRQGRSGAARPCRHMRGALEKLSCTLPSRRKHQLHWCRPTACAQMRNFAATVRS